MPQVIKDTKKQNQVPPRITTDLIEGLRSSTALMIKNCKYLLISDKPRLHENNEEENLKFYSKHHMLS